MIKKLLSSVLIIFAFLGFSQTVLAQTATLYFSPSSGTFSEGESFWLTIMVDTKGVAVNAVAAYISYPEDKLEPLGVNVSGSVMTIWAEKKASGGNVEIAGGEPTPGFSGIKKIASVGFKVKASSGSVNLKFSEDSAVLTDAENQNILNLTTSGQGNYTFKPKPVTPPRTVTPSAKETPLPIISEVEVKDIAQSEATIFWLTDIETDFLIEYGLTADYGFSISGEKFTKEHSLKISELLPGTFYHFKVGSQTKAGQQSETDDLTFFTLGYLVEIQVLDLSNRKPLVGAEVTFPGPPQETKITDQEGKVLFDSLPLGRQWISIKHKDLSLSYPLDISAEEEIQKVEVLFKEPAPTSKTTLFSLIILTIFLVGLAVYLIWRVFYPKTKISPKIKF